MPVDPTPAVLDAVRALGAAGAPGDPPPVCETLTGGTYNTVTRVTFADGRDWVVKVPPTHSAGLRYEQHLLVGEAAFHEAAATVGGDLVPRVVHADPVPGSATGAYVVMTACPGRPWSDLAADLTESERRRLRTELGALVGRLHTVTGSDGFGYPGEPLGPLSPTWREAFTAMAGAVLDDAEAYAARLPRPASEIRALLGSAAYALDEVVRPALVHFDLWEGNVLLTGERGARALGGIIDGERMFWGDPAADLVSTALLGDIEDDEDFLAGYAAGAGSPVVFTASLRLRLALYRSYLYLIMLVETVPRQASGEALEWVWTRVAPQLDAALGEVAGAVSRRTAG
ncbi:aminoglycoside phosphotransferase family protein [Streptomyces sp. BpilaLS-43]|uniref:phosphotransferase family protein n=1 Tax=unclassified Streptomyces TaxID=2593676 RepID=UPI00081B1017|nr:aminoglycoside phosphotransferase family protein [Streptomyces sp. BpilaLS-43]MYX72310.1 phosphotransferase [Streptomyces sp. SID3915]SCD37665.1 Fructosamine-3-kinase [Streptomyces sp. BpilaLS-43]